MDSSSSNSSMVVEAEFVGQGTALVVPMPKRLPALPRKAKAAAPSSKGVILYKTKAGEKRFLAQVRLKGHKPLTKSFGSFKEAADWKQDQEVMIKKQGPLMAKAVKVPSEMLMPELFATYIDQCELHGKRVSYAISAQFRRLSAHPVLKNLRVTDMNLAVMRQYCVARKNEGVVPSTVDSEFIRVNLAIEKCASWLNWGKYNPLDGVRAELAADGLISDSVERSRRPSAQEQADLLAYFKALAATEIPMADIFDISRINGFRRGEITGDLQANGEWLGGLRWSNLAENSIKLLRKDAANKDIGKRECLVPLIPAARAIIDRQPRIEGEDRIFPYNPDTISQHFTNACRKLKIEDLRFHDLRHEAISIVSQHVGLTEGMMVSGHKTTKSYMRYVNYGKEEANKIAAKLAAIQ